ncbi:MAG: hypothetical protein ACRCSS_00295 [Shewanella sp.]
MKSEHLVVVIAIVAWVLALAGHVVLAFTLEDKALGMLTAITPFLLMLITLVATLYAAATNKPDEPNIDSKH